MVEKEHNIVGRFLALFIETLATRKGHVVPSQNDLMWGHRNRCWRNCDGGIWQEDGFHHVHVSFLVNAQEPLHFARGDAVVLHVGFNLVGLQEGGLDVSQKKTTPIL